MKWFKRLLTTSVVVSGVGIGLYFENIYLVALFLSISYLISTLLYQRFENARENLFNVALSNQETRNFLNAPVIPLSCDEGVQFFQQKGEVHARELGGYHFSVSELQSNLLKGKGVRSYELENKFHRAIRESRFLIVLAQVMGIAVAGYEVYFNQEYLYIAIPVLMAIYHFFFYTHIFESARALKFSDSINKDREFLTLLMGVYVETVLGFKETQETSVDVFPMGDILVKFKKDDAEHFYYVPYDDRLVMEELLYLAMEEDEDDELESA